MRKRKVHHWTEKRKWAREGKKINKPNLLSASERKRNLDLQTGGGMRGGKTFDNNQATRK